MERELGKASWSAAWVCKMRRFAGNGVLSSSSPVQGMGRRFSPAGSGMFGGLHPSAPLLSAGAGFLPCLSCGLGFRARTAETENAGNSQSPNWSLAAAAGLSGGWLGGLVSVDIASPSSRFLRSPSWPLVLAGCLPAHRVMALSVPRSDIFITNSWGNAARMADFFNHAITQLFPLLYIGFNMSYIR